MNPFAAALIAYVRAIAIGLDVLVNAVLGGTAYQTISCRIGLSMEAGGWASRVPWPGPLRRHFLAAVYSAVV